MKMTTENDSKQGIQIRGPWCRYLHMDEVANSMELSSWPHVCTQICMIQITLHSNKMSPEFNEIQ